jgi:heme/copper-type cytochrome/quinol oxidase subunit 4
MNRQLIKDALGWGIGLWLIGYLFGIVLFLLVPADLIGWVLSPIATVITLWVLMKKVAGDSMGYYIKVAIAWTVIAILFDYLFLVKLLNPADGYYKLDVYLYYILTLFLPILVGWYKVKKMSLESGGMGRS